MYTHRYEHLDLLSSSLVRSKPEANDRGAVESNPRMNLCLHHAPMGEMQDFHHSIGEVLEVPSGKLT